MNATPSPSQDPRSTAQPVLLFGQIPDNSGELTRSLDEVGLCVEARAAGSPEDLAKALDERAETNRKLAESESAKLELIERLRYSIDELSNPILEVWDDVLVMPIIGVIDSRRTADMVQRLLNEVARLQASFVIVDLTGVEIVDTRPRVALGRARAAARARSSGFNISSWVTRSRQRGKA